MSNLDWIDCWVLVFGVSRQVNSFTFTSGIPPLEMLTRAPRRGLVALAAGAFVDSN